METKEIWTQTEKSNLQKQSKNKTKEVLEPVEVTDVELQDNTKSIIQSCEFEIFGIVQDVSFRHYTLRRAQKLSIRGWCMNSDRNTIKGVIQGYPKNFEAMRLWLKYTGSPTSRIDKCVFGPTTELEEFSFEDFAIRGKERKA